MTTAIPSHPAAIPPHVHKMTTASKQLNLF